MGTTMNGDSERSASESREDKTEILIEEIQAYPILWNRQYPGYSDFHKKQLVWGEISSRLGLNVELIKAKWKNLRDSYKKCLDRERGFSKSGSGLLKQPRCRYYNKMAFLRDVITNQQKISNITLQATPPLAPLPLDVVDKSSPAPSFASNSSFATDEFRSIEPSTKASTVNRNKMAPDMDPEGIFLIENIKRKAMNADDDPDDLFCRSLVATLKRLPQKKNQMAKLKIQQLLFDIEYEE